MSPAGDDSACHPFRSDEADSTACHPSIPDCDAAKGGWVVAYLACVASTGAAKAEAACPGSEAYCTFSVAPGKETPRECDVICVAAAPAGVGVAAVTVGATSGAPTIIGQVDDVTILSLPRRSSNGPTEMPYPLRGADCGP